MTYQEQLNPWTVQNQHPQMGQQVIARFRRRGDADAYLNTMQNLRPGLKLSVAFATTLPEKAAIAD
ncbi:MAG: hypothetical protein VKL39_10295 [Leptolyngbyaceae bacterium]|nr:hypothetical protein [Leptolyngbyaceae bacterium]